MSQPRKRPHHGTTAQQLDALDRLAAQTAADLAQVKAALVVMGVLELAEPQVAPSPRHLRLVKEGQAS